MKTITVIVNAKTQSKEFSDARLAFWDALARESDNSDARRNLEAYAVAGEQRLKNYLPMRLHSEISSALLSSRGVSLEPGRPSRSGRLIVSVEDIDYGSMKVELGIPDIDAFIELLGNNSEAFEAIFGAYFPRAFEYCLEGEFIESLEFKVDIPSDVQKYINSSSNGVVTKSEGTAKEKGTAILINLIQSPLILPIILICFLWYYARQDMVDERRITYGLVQTLVTEQTAVISLLKDTHEDQAKDRAATESKVVKKAE